MNPLLNAFPRSVKVRGEIFPIRWDFRSCIQLVQINEDPALAVMERLQLMLELFYPKELPEDLNEAVRMMIKFLNCGEESGGEDEEAAPRLFSYEKDGGFIYTAVLQQYGVDLECDTVHWWKFLAMLGDLNDRCYFSRLLRLRKGWIEGTLSKEERDAFLALGEAGLPPETPLDAEEQAALAAFLAELGETEKEVGV